MERRQSGKKTSSRKHWCFFDGPTWRELLTTEPKQVLSAAKYDFVKGCRKVGVREQDYVVYVVSADVVIPDKVGACIVIDPQSSDAKTSCLSALAYPCMWDLYAKFRSAVDTGRVGSMESFHPLGANGRTSGDMRQLNAPSRNQKKRPLRRRPLQLEKREELDPPGATTTMLFSPERGLCIDDGKSPPRQSAYAMLPGVLWPIIMREKPLALKRSWKIDVSNCLQVSTKTIPSPFVLQNCVAGIYSEPELKTPNLHSKLSRYGFFNCWELYRRTEKEREEKQRSSEESTKLPPLVPAAKASPAAPSSSTTASQPSTSPSLPPATTTSVAAPEASPSASPGRRPTTAAAAPQVSQSPSPMPESPKPTLVTTPEAGQSASPGPEPRPTTAAAAPEARQSASPAGTEPPTTTVVTAPIPGRNTPSPSPVPQPPAPPPLMTPPASPPAAAPEDPGIRRRSSLVFLPPFPKTSSTTTTDRYPKQLSTSIMPSNVISPLETQHNFFNTQVLPSTPHTPNNPKTSGHYPQMIDTIQTHGEQEHLQLDIPIVDTDAVPQGTEEGVIPSALSTARPSEPLPGVSDASPNQSGPLNLDVPPPIDSPLATFPERFRLPSLHSLPDNAPNNELHTARPSEGSRPRKVSVLTDDASGPPSSRASIQSADRVPVPVKAIDTAGEVPSVETGESVPDAARSPSIVTSHHSLHEVLQSLHNSNGRLVIPGTGEVNSASNARERSPSLAAEAGGAAPSPAPSPYTFPSEHRTSVEGPSQTEGIIEVIPISVCGSVDPPSNQLVAPPVVPIPQPVVTKPRPAVPKLEEMKNGGVFCLQSRHDPSQNGKIEKFNIVTLSFAGERWEETMFEMGPSIIQGLEADVENALRGVFGKRFSVEFTVTPEKPSGSKVELGFRGDCTHEERERRFKLLYEYDFPEMWQVYRLFCGEAAFSPRVLGETARGDDPVGRFRFQTPPVSSGEANIDLLFGGFKWKEVLQQHRRDVENTFIQDVQDAIRKTGLPISAPRRVHLCGRDNVLDTTTSLEFVHMPLAERKACREAIARYTYPKLLNLYKNYANDTEAAWVVLPTPESSYSKLEAGVCPPKAGQPGSGRDTSASDHHSGRASLTDIPPTPRALEHHEEHGSRSRSRSRSHHSNSRPSSSHAPSPPLDGNKPTGPLLDQPEEHRTVFSGHQWKRVIRHHRDELNRAAVLAATNALQEANINEPEGGLIPHFSTRGKKGELLLKPKVGTNAPPVLKEDAERRRAALKACGFDQVWAVYYRYTKTVSSPSPTSATTTASHTPQKGVLHAEYSEAPKGTLKTMTKQKTTGVAKRRTPAFSSTERQEAKEEEVFTSDSEYSEDEHDDRRSSSGSSSSSGEMHGAREHSSASMLSSSRRSSLGSTSSSHKAKREHHKSKRKKRNQKKVKLQGGNGGPLTSGESSFDVFFCGDQWNKVLEQFPDVTEHVFMRDIQDALEGANLTMPVIYNPQLSPRDNVMEASASLQFAHESAEEQKFIAQTVKCYTYPKMLAFYAEVTKKGFTGNVPTLAHLTSTGFRWPTLQGQEIMPCSVSPSPPVVEGPSSSSSDSTSSSSSSSSSSEPPVKSEKGAKKRKRKQKSPEEETQPKISFSIQLHGDRWEELLFHRKAAMEDAFREDVQMALKLAALPLNPSCNITFTLDNSKHLKVAANLALPILTSTRDAHYKALTDYDYPKLLSLYHTYSTLRQPTPKTTSQPPVLPPLRSARKGGALDHFTLKFPSKVWGRLLAISPTELQQAAKKDLIDALRPTKEEIMNHSTPPKIQIFGLKLAYSPALNGMKLKFSLRDRTSNQEQRDVQAIEAHDFHELWNTYWRLREQHIPSGEDEDEEGVVEVVDDEAEAEEKKNRDEPSVHVQVTSYQSSTENTRVPAQRQEETGAPSVKGPPSPANAEVDQKNRKTQKQKKQQHTMKDKETTTEKVKHQQEEETPPLSLSARPGHPATFAFPLPLFDDSLAGGSSSLSSQRQRSTNSMSSTSFHTNPNRTVHNLGSPIPTTLVPTIHLLQPVRERVIVQDGEKTKKSHSSQRKQKKRKRHDKEKENQYHSRRKPHREHQRSSSRSPSSSESSSSESDSSESTSPHPRHRPPHHHPHNAAASSSSPHHPHRVSGSGSNRELLVPVPPLALPPERIPPRRYDGRRPPPLANSPPDPFASPPRSPSFSSDTESSPLGEPPSHRSSGRERARARAPAPPHPPPPTNRLPAVSPRRRGRGGTGTGTGQAEVRSTPAVESTRRRRREGGRGVDGAPSSSSPDLGGGGYHSPSSLSAFSASGSSHHHDHSHRSKHESGRGSRPSPSSSGAGRRRGNDQSPRSTAAWSPSPRTPRNHSPSNSSYNSSAFSSSSNSGRF